MVSLAIELSDCAGRDKKYRSLVVQYAEGRNMCATEVRVDSSDGMGNCGLHIASDICCI